MLRITLLQGTDQRLRGAGFTDRHRMHPQPRPGRSRVIIKTKPFADMLQVLALATRAPQQAQHDQRQRQVPEQGVEEAHWFW